jgi:hypothetical protein
MDESMQMDTNRFPLPQQFSDAAFRASSGEMAWVPAVAADVIDWLRRNGYGLLGAEIWVIRPDGTICTLFTDAEGKLACWATSIERNEDEPWTAFVARAAGDVLGSITKIDESDVVTPGQVHINLSYVTESEFEALRDNVR